MRGIPAVIAAATLACSGADHQGDPKGPVPLTAAEREAIVAAEAFVRINCYTFEPCDAANAQRELMEGFPSAQVRRSRRNQLMPRAYGISSGQKGGLEPGWTIYFEYTPDWLKGTESLGGPVGLRGVEMSIDLKRAMMVHVDLRRDAVEKVAYPAPRE